jgi:hypothetical protein
VDNEQPTAYVVSWEAITPAGIPYSSGARRVFAESAEDATVRARTAIASDLQLPPESIAILDVRRLEQR